MILAALKTKGADKNFKDGDTAIKRLIPRKKNPICPPRKNHFQISSEFEFLNFLTPRAQTLHQSQINLLVMNWEKMNPSSLYGKYQAGRIPTTAKRGDQSGNRPSRAEVSTVKNYVRLAAKSLNLLISIIRNRSKWTSCQKIHLCQNRFYAKYKAIILYLVENLAFCDYLKQN